VRSQLDLPRLAPIGGGTSETLKPVIAKALSE
jgi:hypothetical protein